MVNASYVQKKNTTREGKVDNSKSTEFLNIDSRDKGDDDVQGNNLSSSPSTSNDDDADYDNTNDRVIIIDGYGSNSNNNNNNNLTKNLY